MARERKKAKTGAKKTKAPVGQGKGGGPKSRDGKARASQNSTTHGMRARPGLILPDELQEDFNEIENGWREEYGPENHAENTLVDQVILNQWLMKRAERRVLQAEAGAVEECGDDPHGWSQERRHTFELMQRYKTTAERAFYRSWNAVQALRKNRMLMDNELYKARNGERLKDELIRKKDAELARIREQLAPKPEAKLSTSADKVDNAAAEAKTAARILFHGQLHPEKKGKALAFDRRMDTVEDGKTVRTLPSANDELIEAVRTDVTFAGESLPAIQPRRRVASGVSVIDE